MQNRVKAYKNISSPRRARTTNRTPRGLKRDGLAPDVGNWTLRAHTRTPRSDDDVLAPSGEKDQRLTRGKRKTDGNDDGIVRNTASSPQRSVLLKYIITSTPILRGLRASPGSNPAAAPSPEHLHGRPTASSASGRVLSRAMKRPVTRPRS